MDVWRNAFRGSVVAVCLLLLAGARAADIPDPLVLASGHAVKTPEDWRLRREQMRDVLLKVQYGHLPPVPDVTVSRGEDREVQFPATASWGVRETATLHFDGLDMTVGWWRPRDVTGPLPVILAMEPVWWDDPFLKNGIVPRVLDRGYALAGFDHNALASFEDAQQHPAQDAHPECDWGVVAVGAWGYRVTMNWLESLPGVDKNRVAIWGHSRRGKACLLAGALDERFAAVVPHMSGMGGSALYRERGGGAQQLEQLLERFWLHPQVFTYIDREEELPFDQHWLHALVAPRPLCIHVGKQDAWGNPLGEQAAYQQARPVYAWLNAARNVELYVGDYGHHDPNGPEGTDSWDTLLRFLDAHFRK